MSVIATPDPLTTIRALPAGVTVLGADIRRLDLATSMVEPPADRWVTPDDILAIFCRNSKTGLQLQANLRLWTPTGEFVQFLMGFTPTADRTINVFGKNLYYGYMVSANIYAVGGTQGNRGQTYVSVNVVRPPLASSLPNWGLGVDYLTGINQIQWPFNRSINSTEGPGVLLGIAGTAPAAGADWSQTVPTAARWRIRGIRALLTTSAAVATRTPSLQLTVGGQFVHVHPGAVSSPASTAQGYSWVPGFSPAATTASESAQVLEGDLSLPAGAVIQILTANLQAGDQWGTPRFEIEEWIED